MPTKSVAVIVVAAGKGERANADGAGAPKQYRPLAGEAVLSRTIRAFLAVDAVTTILPVIHPDHADRYAALGLDDVRLQPPVPGGASRQESVLAGLNALAAMQPDYVLIQDAARPFATPLLVEAVIAALVGADGALPVLPITDTIKRSSDGKLVTATEDRSQLFGAQTPQGFGFQSILLAHQRAVGETRQFTDDAEIAEWAGLTVAMVPGDRNNIKITHPEDFVRAERIIKGDYSMETRIGSGFDFHEFEPGDAVWLGGVRIPHHAKLKGHSDADVALHALTDAILGAIGEGDIGVHFPPSDMQWHNAASKIFLEHAGKLVKQANGRIVNVDVTIVCEAPKIAPHVAAMQSLIGETLGLSTKRIAIKATTAERLGFIGREEGMVAMATASVEMPRDD